MMNPFKMLGDINQMRAQAAKIQAALAAEEFEIKEGNVRIVINGNQEVKLVEINGQADETVRRAINNAIKRSQQAAAGKLAEISNQLGAGGQ